MVVKLFLYWKKYAIRFKLTINEIEKKRKEEKGREIRERKSRRISAVYVCSAIHNEN